MAQAGQRKCLCCGKFFLPDPRNRARQKYCSAAPCRAASKAASQAAWLTQPQNIDYFRDPVHVARVQAWRAAHPGYSTAKPTKTRAPKALQDDSNTQVHDSIEETVIRYKKSEQALQDSLETSTPILAGLIAHLFDLTLQEDIANTIRRLVQLGLDLIDRSHHHESCQTSAAP